jgi:hypothetical protein
MNSLQYVCEKMNVEKSDNKIRLTIEVDFYPATGFLGVNGAPINRGQGSAHSVAAWLSASRFISQMLERFEQEQDKVQRNVA